MAAPGPLVLCQGCVAVDALCQRAEAQWALSLEEPLITSERLIPEDLDADLAKGTQASTSRSIGAMGSSLRRGFVCPAWKPTGSALPPCVDPCPGTPTNGLGAGPPPSRALAAGDLAAETDAAWA